ncbi:MAG TPA: glycine cleavage system protein GcvH [Candidatus Cloacimonetes bacterium]|nr:glycine cleavage system protein GcvH [Candidatus Cloacimonadota bacterium]
MVKKDIFYTESHEWVMIKDKEAVIGITDYAQHELGDIVYIELPEIGDEVTVGEAFGTIEAVKAVEDMISPLSGEIIEVNKALEDNPEIINKSAFEDGWIIKIKISKEQELGDLIDAEAYTQLIED